MAVGVLLNWHMAREEPVWGAVMADAVAIQALMFR
jgi:hypothetical protein